jgi:hypothetical protein
VVSTVTTVITVIRSEFWWVPDDGTRLSTVIHHRTVIVEAGALPFE